jgi:hypothetical protein
VFGRIYSPRKDHPIEFDIPLMNTARDAASAASSVLLATSNGELTPQEASSIMSLVETYRRVLETTEIEAQLQVLEESI